MIMRPIFLLSILLMATATFSQTSLKNGPKVNGIGLGDTREDVLRWMGKPVRQSRKKADECVGGTEMTLIYPGLKFVLWDDPENPKKFTVGMFEVTSGNWNVSGAKIGQSSAQVRKLFGEPSSQDKPPAKKLPVWYYDMDENEGPGNTNFVFRNGKLVSVLSMYMMC